MSYQANQAAELIVKSRKVVAFTGAGISTESGIPDFRSPGGIWSKYDPEDFTFQKFVTEPQTRRKIWGMLIESGLLINAQPNPAHYALAELERLGKLDCVVTQNVDNLHQKAGNSPEKVFELHGNMRQALCLKCDRRFPMEDIIKKLKESFQSPECSHCGGIIKPDAVFFGEPLPEKILKEAISRSRHCDLFMVIGSTLVVYPAAFIPMYAKEAGAKLIIINLSPTPLDAQATVLIRGKAGEVMTKIMEKVKNKLSRE